MATVYDWGGFAENAQQKLADELSKKLSFGADTEQQRESEREHLESTTSSLPFTVQTPFNGTSSKMVETSPTAHDRMTSFLNEDDNQDPLRRHIDDDKDAMIHRLKDEISELEKDRARLRAENDEKQRENERLKHRNSELRKALNKAQQYRRKSINAAQNLMSIGNQMMSLQRESKAEENGKAVAVDGSNGHKTEEKAVEEEELRTNLKIQEQIQMAIALFQEEFGAELDEELNNIESFQYDAAEFEEEEEAMMEHTENEDRFEFIEMVPMGMNTSNLDPLHEPIPSDQFPFVQRQNTRNDAVSPSSPSATLTPNNSTYPHSQSFVGRQSHGQYPFGPEFRIKFTDAHSNPSDSPKPGDPDVVHHEVPKHKEIETQSVKHHDDGGGGGGRGDEEEEDGNRNEEMASRQLTEFEEIQQLQGNKDGDDAMDGIDGRAEEEEEEEDALPEAFDETPQGPHAEHPTPGGPQLSEMDEAENIIHRQRVEEMEYKLNSLSDKMMSMMARIQQLTDKNQELEVSKLELILNTADAMNVYRESIRTLNVQNQRLRDRLKNHSCTMTTT